MIPPTFRLIVDFLWRAKWRWMAPATFYFVLAIVGRTKFAAAFTILPMVAALLSLTLFFAIFDKHSLPLLVSLPLSRRQLGRAFWFATIVIPGALMACVLNPLAFAASKVVFKNARKLTLDADAAVPLLDFGILVFVSCGIAMALAISMAKSRRKLIARGAPRLSARVITTLTTFLMLPFFALVVTVGSLGLTRQVAFNGTPVLIAGLIIVGILFARAELIVDWRMQKEHSTMQTRRMRQRSSWLRGWWALLAPFSRQAAILFGYSVLVFALPIKLKDVIFIIMSGIATGAVIPWIASIRELRMAPIPAQRLASILVALTMLPAAFTWLLVGAVQIAYRASSEAPLTLVLFFLPLQSIALPLLLRFGSRALIGIVALLPTMLAPMVFFLFSAPRLPDGFIYFGWLLILVSYVWTKRELRQSPRKYPSTWTGGTPALLR